MFQSNWATNLHRQLVSASANATRISCIFEIIVRCKLGQFVRSSAELVTEGVKERLSLCGCLSHFIQPVVVRHLYICWLKERPREALPWLGFEDTVTGKMAFETHCSSLSSLRYWGKVDPIDTGIQRNHVIF